MSEFDKIYKCDRCSAEFVGRTVGAEIVQGLAFRSSVYKEDGFFHPAPVRPASIDLCARCSAEFLAWFNKAGDDPVSQDAPHKPR